MNTIQRNCPQFVINFAQWGRSHIKSIGVAIVCITALGLLLLRMGGSTRGNQKFRHIQANEKRPINELPTWISLKDENNKNFVMQAALAHGKALDRVYQALFPKNTEINSLVNMHSGKPAIAKYPNHKGQLGCYESSEYELENLASALQNYGKDGNLKTYFCGSPEMCEKNVGYTLIDSQDKKIFGGVQQTQLAIAKKMDNFADLNIKFSALFLTLGEINEFLNDNFWIRIR